MEIVFVRVDERLVQGQITTRWVNMVGANVILAANDAAAENNLQKKLMKMAAPAGVIVEVEKIDDAAKRIKENAWPNGKLMILIKTPIDLLKLVDAGVDVRKVNVGGVRQPGATIKLSKEVLATEEELVVWKELSEKGIQMEIQWLPNEKSTNLNNLLKKA
jgi:mannose/fructose/N-acetylgalactosamine-specific phosphotransferase system component IIB